MYSVMIKQTQVRSSHSSWVQYGFIKRRFPEEPWSPTLINTISVQLWEFRVMKQKKDSFWAILSKKMLEMFWIEFQMSNFQGQGQRNKLVDWTWLSVALFNYWPWSREKKQFPTEVEPIQAFWTKSETLYTSLVANGYWAKLGSFSLHKLNKS